MDIKIYPRKLNGLVTIPPSKSLSHRAIICASLASGKSTIENIIYSEDINATIKAMESLGAIFSKEENKLIIKGIKEMNVPRFPIDCNESGSTIRFIIPIFSLTNSKVIFTGKNSLLKRPQSIYKDIFLTQENYFYQDETKIIINGSLKPGIFVINGDISSQFISGLLYTLPLLKMESKIIIKGKFESKSYVDLTIDILKKFGIEIFEENNTFIIKGNQRYKPNNYYVEGDYSQFAFYAVLGQLNNRVKSLNIIHNSLQGDKLIVDIIRDMKGRIIEVENGFISQKSQTHGAKIDISQCPDLGPIVAVLGSLSYGKTKIINAKRLRIKESDRIYSTVTMLKSLGADIKELDDSIEINGLDYLEGGSLDSFNDHRIVMSASVASSKCKNPVIIKNADAINKSYPHFFEDMEKLGMKYEIIKG